MSPVVRQVASMISRHHDAGMKQVCDLRQLWVWADSDLVKTSNSCGAALLLALGRRRPPELGGRAPGVVDR
jgi:hypothetical protein